MREAQWVQHFSGKGKKWQVSLENGSTWHISSENGPLYLNKSEYILCDPPSATRKKPSGNQPTQWVRLKGGDGTAYRVQESRLWPTAGNAIAVGNPADSSLLFILPKDACEPCDQPEKWEDVTGEYEINADGRVLLWPDQTMGYPLPSDEHWQRQPDGSLRIMRKVMP